MCKNCGHDLSLDCAICGESVSIEETPIDKKGFIREFVLARANTVTNAGNYGGCDFLGSAQVASDIYDKYLK